MEARRRIVIPTDGSIPDPLPAPHFDSDAAYSARPVRPLAGSDETFVHARPLVATPRKRSGLWAVVAVMVIVFAVGAGLAGGYGIAQYGSFDRPEAILAGSTFHTDQDAPELTFTAPPEEELAENADETGLDGESSDGEGEMGDNIELEPDLFPLPRTGPRAPQNVPPIRRVPAPPPSSDGKEENSRPRRVPDDSESRTSARRRGNTDESDRDRQLRRLGRSMATKIRQIFEGKPQ